MSNPIDVNFHLKKRLETFDKNSADKVQSKMVKGIKVPSFMAIRVKALGWKKEEKLEFVLVLKKIIKCERF